MWQYDWHTPQNLDGYFVPGRNITKADPFQDRNIFEKLPVPLTFSQPHYSPAIWGPERVLNEPLRMTRAMAADRGQEALIHGARRFREIRSLRHEDTLAIVAANKREDDAHAERLRRQGGEKVRWWHTNNTLAQRDSLKTVKMNNFTFSPDRLASCKEVVILNLTGCKLGDQNLVWVSTFVQQNHTLRRLILQGNKITAKGVEQLAPGLAEAPALIELDLSFNPIGDEGCGNLLVAFGQNIRKTIISKIGLGCCHLTHDCTYNLVRLMKDFPSMQCLLLWRNNIGLKTDSDMSGVGLILEELRTNKNMRLVDLTATNINEASLGKFATDLERAAREKRLAEVEHKHRGQRIVNMSDEIESRKATAVWDDEKYEIVALEKELEAERAKFQEQIEIDEREKAKRTKFNVWRDKVKEEYGRDLVEVKRRIRIVLRSNPGITPSTLKRLSPFFDVDEEVDFDAFINQTRTYDNLIKPRRQPGDENYEFHVPPEETTLDMENDWYNPYNVESEYERKARLEREKRRREFLELRKQGYDGAAANNNNNNTSSSSSKQPTTMENEKAMFSDEDKLKQQKRDKEKMTTVLNVDVDDFAPTTQEDKGFGEQAKRARRVAGGATGTLNMDGTMPNKAGGGGGKFLNTASKIDQIMSQIETACELEANNARTRVNRRFEEALNRLRDETATSNNNNNNNGNESSAFARLDFGKLSDAIERDAHAGSVKELPAAGAVAADSANNNTNNENGEAAAAAAATSAEDKDNTNNNNSEQQQPQPQHQQQKQFTEENNVFNQLLQLASAWRRLDYLRSMAGGDSNNEAINQADLFVAAEKEKLVNELAEVTEEEVQLRYGSSNLTDPAQHQLLVALLEEMVNQPEDTPSNLHLTQAILQKLPVSGPASWSDLLAARNLVRIAAAQGSVTYFHLFMHFVDDSSMNMDELVALCTNHPTHRMPLSMLLVQRFGASGGLAFHRSMFQQFLEDICSLRRAQPGEDASVRYDLVATLLGISELALSRTTVPNPSSDNLSVFTRACYEGDAQLLATLNVDPTNDVLGDATAPELNYCTPVMLAVMSNQPQAVRFLLEAYGPAALRLTEARTRPGNDNALDIAVDGNRCEEIKAMLRATGMTCRSDERNAANAARQRHAEEEERKRREERESLVNNPHNMTNKPKGSRAALAKQLAANNRK